MWCGWAGCSDSSDCDAVIPRCRQEKEEASRALEQKTLDSKRALGSLAGYRKATEVGGRVLPVAGWALCA